MSGESLTASRLKALQKSFDKDPANRRMLNAVTKTTLDDVALNRDAVIRNEHIFSTHLDEWSVTNQMASGRCWCFAGLNLFRVGAMKKLKLKNFEFSQNWTLFWDKIERANWFLECIIDTAKKPADDRLVEFMCKDPIGDGGQWNMFVNVVKKYGLVPKAAMPETQSSSNTGRMNSSITALLREAARNIRENAKTTVQRRKLKDAYIETIYRVLCIHLGTPPSSFEWQWRDSKNKHHRLANMTPKKFAEKYLTVKVDDYVCLVNDPRKKNPYNKTYTVDRLGNVVGGKPVIYLNVDINTMKQAAMRTLLDNEPVWMGCDVGKKLNRPLGILDDSLYDYEGAYNCEFNLSKADRLTYRHSAMSHAMLFTGVDVIQKGSKKIPRRWRIENSWGEKGGKKGFLVMDDGWFTEHMYEIAVKKKYLSPKLKAALKTKPKVLPAWDPMGALAR